MMLISTVVGGLFIYVIFERCLKKALHRAQDQRKAIEVSTLIAAVIAVGLAAGCLVYTLTAIDALQERVAALEKEAQNPPRERP
jgi:fumarate reductase subunit D